METDAFRIISPFLIVVDGVNVAAFQLTGRFNSDSKCDEE